MSSTITLPDCPTLTHHSLSLATGCRLHYVDTAAHHTHAGQSRDGKVLMLVHGWPDFWYGWRKQIPALSAAGYRVIAIDLRGMGASVVEGPGSDKDVSKYTYKKVNEDITALLRHLCIPQIIIIGHDWGGPTVWHYSRRYPWRTHAVASLLSPYRPRKSTYVSIKDIAERDRSFRYQLYLGGESDQAARELESNVPRFVSATYRTSQADERVGKWMRPEHKEFLEGFPQHIAHSRLVTEEEYNHYIEAWQQVGFRASLNWYATAKANYDQENDPADDEESQQAVARGFKMAAEIIHPCFILTAGRDNVLKPKLTEGMERWCRQLTRTHVEDSGHWVGAEQPAQTNRYLLQWIEQLPPIQANLNAPKQPHSKL